MSTRRSVLVSILSVVAIFTTNIVQAADPPATTISIEGMHCAGCAAKVSRNLQSIEGVNEVQVSAEKAVAIVSAKTNTKPSPRALWEAVEKSGYKPTKLVGPAGTFTSKPKS